MSFDIFAERRFGEIEEGLLESMRSRISKESPSYVLNVDEGRYVEHLLSEYSFDQLQFAFDNVSVSQVEREIPAEWFPSTFHVFAGKRYLKPVVVYHIPFVGDEKLLHVHPNPGIMNSVPVDVRDGAVCFEIICFWDDPDQVKAAADSKLRLIRDQAAYLAANVAAYNTALRGRIVEAFQKRVGELQARHKLLEGLGVPIKKSANVPATFAVPVVRMKAVPKPVTPPAGGPPEPTLGEGLYEEILKTIHETGRVFERLPSTYASRKEEDLRDHLILMLEPRFEGSTTGETFNKAGKTDILIRHEKKNVFVAECKVWKGAKQHHKTVDQILSYLTWRDSKSAIVYFVHDKEIAAALRAIEEATARHPDFVTLKGRREESWFDYRFHLPGDPGREIRLAVLVFHLPR